MILDNITRAIRTQNYYAVGLEFVIVIAGVVIGFQINAWNEARSESAREAAYLQRLKSEIEDLERTRAERVSARRQANAELIAFSAILSGDSAIAPRQAQCTAIGASYIVSNPTDNLAVLDELLAVGRLDVFSEPLVREAISRYLLVTKRAQDANGAAERIVTVLHDAFPELIAAEIETLEEDPSRVFPTFRCDFEAMLTDPVFANAFATNLVSYASHVYQNRLVDEALTELRRVVDRALAGTAPDETGRSGA